MPACPNCQESVKDNWTHCPHCGANMKEKKYSKDDDPLDKLTKKVDKMAKFIEDRYADDDDEGEGNPEIDDDKKKKGGKDARKTRKPLFG